MAILDTLHLPFQLPPVTMPATPVVSTPRLSRWLPTTSTTLSYLPHDALTLALLAVLGAVLVLSLALRRLLPSRRPGTLTTPHALSFTSPEPAAPAQAPTKASGPSIRLARLLPPLKPRFALPAPTALLDRLAELFDLLSDEEPIEPAPGSEKPFALAPAPVGQPTRHRRAAAPPLPSPPPLSAAKLIMSRHHVRKPYRSPPVPGAPRRTPPSRLVEPVA